MARGIAPSAGPIRMRAPENTVEQQDALRGPSKRGHGRPPKIRTEAVYKPAEVELQKQAMDDVEELDILADQLRCSALTVRTCRALTLLSSG